MKKTIVLIIMLGFLLLSTMSTVNAIYNKKPTASNSPPSTPSITGPTSVKMGIFYNYTFVSTDPDGDDVYYYIAFGDGVAIVWSGPHKSGEEVTFVHAWDEFGSLTVQAKAKDTYGAESDWGRLTVNISANQQIVLRRFALFNKMSSLKTILQNIQTTKNSGEHSSSDASLVVKSDSSDISATTKTSTPNTGSITIATTSNSDKSDSKGSQTTTNIGGSSQEPSICSSNNHQSSTITAESN